MGRSRGAAAGSQPKGGSLLWLQGLACGALVTFATPMVLLSIVLLSPVVLCRLMDTDPGRPCTRAVAICTAPCALAPLWHLWQARDAMQAALDLLSDPATTLPAWAAASVAWACCQVLPVAIRTIWLARDAARIRHIERELQALRNEWDLD